MKENYQICANFSFHLTIMLYFLLVCHTKSHGDVMNCFPRHSMHFNGNTVTKLSFFNPFSPCTCQPLADGASNPSLHEQSKLPPMPNEESSSSSDGESLSQEQDNNDSSQFIANMKLPKSLQNQSFTRVFHYPHTLTHTGWEPHTFWRLRVTKTTRHPGNCVVFTALKAGSASTVWLCRKYNSTAFSFRKKSIW